MEVEHSQNIIIPNNNFDLCDYFNKFPQITNATIRIGNKNILINKEILMKYSKFFHDFIKDNPHANNVYILQTEYPISFVEKVISYLYGCELIFNISYFTIYYKIADYLRIDELTDYLRENLKEGFDNRKYDLLQALKIIIDIFYIGDNQLNEILLSTIANNFMFLRDQLNAIDINILRAIISRDDFNIDLEQELIFFLNYYYAKHQNDKLDIDIKLMSNIRMLTLSIPEISDVSNLLLSELPTYRKLINKSSKRDDIISKAHLIINYPNISIPRTSVVIAIFNKRPEISNYKFGEQLITNFNAILPIFPAIVMSIDLGRILKLRTLNNIIFAEINRQINIPKVGSMILIVDSIMTSEVIRNTNFSFNMCLINKYEVIFEHVPKIFYK